LGVNVHVGDLRGTLRGAVDSSMVKVFAKLVDPPADPAQLWEQYPLKKQRFRERMAAHAPFAEGIAEFFRELSAQYKLVWSLRARTRRSSLSWKRRASGSIWEPWSAATT